MISENQTTKKLVRKELTLQFDYLNGPIWKDKIDVKTGEMTTGIPCVDNDKVIRILDDEAGKIYESLYSFDAYGKGCSFNNEEFIRRKDELLGIVETILTRLSKINDGTFVVVDKATEMLQYDKGPI